MSSMFKNVKTGDKVIVEVEGTVTFASSNCENIEIGDNDFYDRDNGFDVTIRSVQVIARPSRWTDGDVIREVLDSNRKFVWVRKDGHWESPNSTITVEDDIISRNVDRSDSNCAVLFQAGAVV